MRTYSRYSKEAVQLLGSLIRIGRKERKMTVQEVAERAGISRGTVQRIEAGSPGCEIGLVFELAAIVGVSLFESDAVPLKERLERSADKISLLPKRIRKNQVEPEDDF